MVLTRILRFGLLGLIPLVVFCAPRPIRVLFIGNSFTYFNNMPELLEGLGQSATPAIAIETTLLARGGATLREAWERGEAKRLIEHEPWDYVVLQEQTALGHVFLVNGVQRIVDTEKFKSAVRLFDNVIRRAGAKTVLLVTAAPRRAPEDQQALDYAYVSIAREIGAIIAPVGPAWAAARSQDVGLVLHDADGLHPSTAGSYLSACTLYSVLLSRSPVGLTGTIEGPHIDAAGQSHPPNVTLLDLPPSQCRFLQRVAWQTVEIWQKSEPRSSFEKPAAPVLPTVERGDVLSINTPRGEWFGDLRLLFFPAKMDLRLARAGKALSAAIDISFDGKAPDLEATALEVERQGNEISFRDDSQSVGIFSYRMVKIGHWLSGVAKITNRSTGDLIAVGSFDLEQQ